MLPARITDLPDADPLTGSLGRALNSGFGTPAALRQIQGWGHQAPYWNFFLAGAAAAAASPIGMGRCAGSAGGGRPPHPSKFADIMSATQWRHLKLAYSGKVSNWPLANYELGQIQQSFSAATELYPTLQGVPIAQLIKDESGPPLADSAKRSSGRTTRISPGPLPSSPKRESLPSGRESGLHRHPYPDVLPLQQSAVSPRTTVT